VTSEYALFLKYTLLTFSQIMTATFAGLGVVDTWIMFLFYDGPTPPAGVFDNFTSIAHISDNTKTRSYYDLLKFNDFGVIKTQNWNIYTETIPLPSAKLGPEFLGVVYNTWRNVTKENSAVPGREYCRIRQCTQRGLT